MPIPQPILDQLNTVQGLKDTNDSDRAHKQETARALSQAQSDDDQAAQAVAASDAALNAGRDVLEGIENVYFSPGGNLPSDG